MWETSILKELILLLRKLSRDVKTVGVALSGGNVDFEELAKY
jgi:hypothetical protein